MAETTANARHSIGAEIAAPFPLGAGMALVRWEEPDQHHGAHNTTCSAACPSEQRHRGASATNNTKR